MRDAAEKASKSAVEDLLCRLKDDYPEPAEPPGEEAADGQRFRRRPDPSIDEWKRLASRSTRSE